MIEIFRSTTSFLDRFWAKGMNITYISVVAKLSYNSYCSLGLFYKYGISCTCTYLFEAKKSS